MLEPTVSRALGTQVDPAVPDWSAVELEDAWVDRLALDRPGGLWTLLSAVRGRRAKVRVDRHHALFAAIPRYALLEFHNVPNGNYSRRLTHGYITGFDRSMLGVMQRTRSQIASLLAGCRSVLDVGTAGGKVAAALQAAGIPDVWGVDLSPYLLRHAAAKVPGVRFLQAAAEDLPFAAARFDGIAVCFVFHEMPPHAVRKALQGFARMLRPGGRVVIAEPSRSQLEPVRLRALLTPRGWRHLYFRMLATSVFEPFLPAWHRLDKAALFAEAGFDIIARRDELPIDLYTLERRRG